MLSNRVGVRSTNSGASSIHEDIATPAASPDWLPTTRCTSPAESTATGSEASSVINRHLAVAKRRISEKHAFSRLPFENARKWALLARRIEAVDEWIFLFERVYLIRRTATARTRESAVVSRKRSVGTIDGDRVFPEHSAEHAFKTHGINVPRRIAVNVGIEIGWKSGSLLEEWSRKFFNNSRKPIAPKPRKKRG